MNVTISFIMSIDGYLDDHLNSRLILSPPAHYEYIHKIRAQHDAILVGANTVRKDNPKLNTRNKELAKERLDRGQAIDPIKVTMTGSGNLSPDNDFFRYGANEKRIYTDADGVGNLDPKLYDLSQINILSDLSLDSVLEDLQHDGIQSILIEGGANILQQALQNPKVQDLHIAIAPFFLGHKDNTTRIQAYDSLFPPQSALTLVEKTVFDDIIALHYQKSKTS
jgi:5-amino-6-(5-phosphoribosylamino)uracil reductase